MDFLKKLPTPEELIEQLPFSNELNKKKQKRDAEIKSVFAGKTNKFILAIGPCSADRVESVVDYASRLGELQKEVEDNIIIIPRVYTGKPRTIGNGYKGIIHQPYICGREDMAAGVVAMRNIHKAVIEASGLFPVDELLYPELVQYVADLLSYVVIGARSVENQEHRLVSSGINVPVGMKNPVSGNVGVMLNAIETAQCPHHFLFNGWEVISRGNEYTHAVLRGYVGDGGIAHQNYSYDELCKIYEAYKERDLENRAFIIDCNHSNSNKQFLKQIDIAKDIFGSMEKNPDLRQVVKGLMIESYIEDGCQKVDGKVYGQSITDPCLGWDKTRQLILDINDKFASIKIM